MNLSPRWQWKLDRWRERIVSTFRAPSEPARPRLCPVCGRLVGATATKCHECGARVNFSLAAASQTLSHLMPTESPITYMLLGVNGLLFVLSVMVSMRISEHPSLMGINGEALYRLGARQTVAILSGEVWRLVTPIFLHGGVLHIVFNTWVLMDLGPQLEEEYGSPRYFFLYVVTGIFSFVVSTAWNLFMYGGYGISIGASGSLMGLIGLMLAITTRRGGAMMQSLRGQLLKWVAYIFVLGLFFNADNAAHLGGLAAGFLLGKVMADRQPVAGDERRRAYALGWLAALIVIVSFGFMVRNFFRIS